MDNTQKKKRILIVEDEKNIAQMLAFNMTAAGYDYDIAYDGEIGLDKALNLDFDLILLDIMLPKLDGFEVCRRIRAKKSTPIIIVTAREEEIDKILGLDLGADDYVTKPFSIKVLLARVKSNIRRAAGELVAESSSEPSAEGHPFVRQDEQGCSQQWFLSPNANLYRSLKGIVHQPSAPCRQRQQK